MKKLLLSLLIFCPLFLYSEDFKLTKSSITTTTYTREEEDSEAFSPGISIYSKIEEIEISINGRGYKEEKLILTNLEPGNYHIKLEKSGYVSEDLWVTLGIDKYIKIVVSLEREAGYLTLEIEPEIFEIYLNETLVEYGRPIPTGHYNLKLKSFGYKDYYENIYIIHDRVIKLKPELEKADFEFTGLKLSKERFNPLAYGSFNSSQITVSVNGPEKGQFKILGSNNETLFKKNVNFDTWDFSIGFNGIINGKMLKDGKYTVSFVSDSKEIEKVFIVDTSLYVKSVPVMNKWSGLALTPTAEINSVTTFETSLSVGIRKNQKDIGISFKGSNNFGLSLFGGIDLTVEESIDFIDFYCGFIGGIKFNSLTIAPQVNYCYTSALIDGDLPDSNKIGFYLPFTLAFNWLNFTLSPGINYHVENDLTKNISGGIHYDNQLYRFGLSSIASTVDFNSIEFGYGIEFNLLLGQSQNYLGTAIIFDHNFNISGLLKFNLLH